MFEKNSFRLIPYRSGQSYGKLAELCLGITKLINVNHTGCFMIVYILVSSGLYLVNSYVYILVGSGLYLVNSYIYIPLVVTYIWLVVIYILVNSGLYLVNSIFIFSLVVDYIWLIVIYIRVSNGLYLVNNNLYSG